MRDVTLAKTRGYGWKAGEWLMGVFGGVAAFLGFFIMFGPEEDYVGLGGDVAWQVGEISSAWMYGLIIGGLVLLAGTLALIIAGRSRTPVASTPRGDLLWHSGVFVLVNAFLWAQDFALGTGLDYAYLVTIPWGIGLAFHGYRYFSGDLDAEPMLETGAAEQEQKELQYH